MSLEPVENRKVIRSFVHIDIHTWRQLENSWIGICHLRRIGSQIVPGMDVATLALDSSGTQEEYMVDRLQGG